MLIAAVAAAFVVLPAGSAVACDPLDPSACLYPWPNDHFTRADPTSPTGKRLALRDEWMPKNRFGKPVSSAPYNFGIPHITAFPFGGSALAVWDTGIPAPPTTNTPPRAGQDPHGAPRNSPAARRQKSEFLRTDGAVVDVCGGAPCVP